VSTTSVKGKAAPLPNTDSTEIFFFPPKATIFFNSMKPIPVPFNPNRSTVAATSNMSKIS
jgi:hypothetical protein